MPRSETLEALARALSVGVQELVRPVPTLHRVRFRSDKKMKRREQILTQVGRWLSDFNQLEELLGSRSQCRLGKIQGDCGEVAAKARERLGLGPREPIRDICGLLEAGDVKVYPIRMATDAFFGLSVGRADGGPAVVVNTWNRISVERWIFSAVHELGHLVLHLDAYDVDRSDEEDGQEREANRFAAAFLMPEAAFRSEWEESCGLHFVDRVLKVKRIFRVSYSTLLYRLGEIGLGDDDLWRRFHSEYARRTGKRLLKTDEPDALPPAAFRAGYPEPAAGAEPDRLSASDFSEDRLFLLVRKAVEGAQITLARGAEVLGLSLMEMRGLAASWVR